MTKILSLTLSSLLATSIDPDSMLSLSVSDLSKRLENGSIKAVDLMKTTLDRIEQVNPRCNAVIALRERDTLLQEAATADASPRKGWLHGIPIAIKDLSNCAGLPTTMGGSPLCDDWPPVSKLTDKFVRRMLNAGAIPIGKTNTPESGLGSHTFNKRWGTTVNPYSPLPTQPFTAGGSSGGAAVAVATRMLSFADGTDMMGSLRNPAGWNNIYSHRPTAGLLEYVQSRRNPLPYPISTAGPLARSPGDLALCLETMAGSDKFEASQVTTTSENSLDGMKIAWLGDWAGAYPTDADILSHCRQALEGVISKECKIEVVNVCEPLFSPSDLWSSWTTIRSAVAAESEVALHGREKLERYKHDIRLELKWELARGMEITDEALDEAKDVALAWRSVLDNVFDEYDAIALPSAQTWPFPADWDWPKQINGVEMDTYHRWMEIMVPVSLAGLPCTTVPAGFGGPHDLPIGIQLAGSPGADASTLQLAATYHEVIDWPSKRPPVV